MTDFIHEQHKEEPKTQAPQPVEQEAEEMDEGTGQKRVYGYIFLLFIVAFSLLLWSFFMNQRSTDEVLTELRGNASSIQSTLDRNVTLEQRVDDLEKTNAELREELRVLREESEKMQELSARTLESLHTTGTSLMAMDYLHGLESALQSKDEATAEACMERLEETVQPYDGASEGKPLKDYLPEQTSRKDPDGTDAETPAQAYARLRAELLR